jgi:hypothetical protein
MKHSISDLDLVTIAQSLRLVRGKAERILDGRS